MGKKEYFCVALFTRVFVEVKLNLRASTEVLNVIKSPSGHIVSSEWYVYRLPRSSSQSSRDNEKENQ